MNGTMLKARYVPFQLVAFYAYNQSRNLSPRTLDGYDKALKRFYHWFVATYGVGAGITPRRIRDFAAQRLASGKAPLTVRTELTALRAFFSFLVVDEVIKEADNPLKLVRNPRVPIPEIIPLSPDQTRKLLDCFCKDDRTEWRNYVICLLILDTGLRISEVANLTVGDIDFSRSCISIIGKGQKRRTAYVGRRVRVALSDYIERCRPWMADGHMTLFPPITRSTKPTIEPRALSAIIREKMDEAGIPRANSSAHRLRHTFAVNFVRAGGNVFALQRLLGHTDLEMTRRYVTLFEDDLAEAHRKASPVDRMAV